MGVHQQLHLFVRHRRGHPARAHRVGAHAQRAIVAGDGAHQADQRVLGGDVAADLRPGGQRGDRGHEQQVAAALDQLRQAGARAGESAVEVAVHRPLPLRVAHLGNALEAHAAGATDQAVDAPGVAQNGRQQRVGPALAAAGVAHQRLRADLIRQRRQRFRAAADDEHPIALRRQQTGAGGADAGAAAGNHNHSIHDSASPSVGRSSAGCSTATAAVRHPAADSGGRPARG
ncbi:Uncharacterised protein [Acinetobacter baumannii]|nr:Uncharacterised protein [Acinetobacter baumannii]